MANIKIKRISSQIAKEVSDILSNEAQDKELHQVTVTSAEVTNDLSFAKIYITCMNEEEKETILKDLNEATGFIRKELSERIELRHTPKISFYYDESIEYGNNIERIIKKIHEQDNE